MLPGRDRVADTADERAHTQERQVVGAAAPELFEAEDEHVHRDERGS
jgi:hypothetical protein